MLTGVRSSVRRAIVVGALAAATVFAFPSTAQAQTRSLVSYDLGDGWVVVYSTGSSAGPYHFYFNKYTGEYVY